MAREQTEIPNRMVNYPQDPSQIFISNEISTCKYNFFNFIPKNLWYQFQKLANIYFLIIAVLQVIPEISVSGGVPNILLPLAFVLILSAIKDLLEDLKRRRSDNEENSKEVLVWKEGLWSLSKWKDLLVGEIVKINRNEYFPADLVLLTTSEVKGNCYVETKNLDGETNLKSKSCIRSIHEHFEENDIVEDTLELSLEVEPQNALIYKFKGTISFENTKFPLFYEQLLLRGSSLRNTDWVMGIIIYTGHDSKIMLNSSKSKSKFSQLESQMNYEIIYIFTMQTFICLFCALYYALWFAATEKETEQYIELDEGITNLVAIYILNFLSWMLIFTNFVPISLIVTLEIVKFIQAIFICWDLEMYYSPTDTPAKVQSSNLNEELGQIHYIFSDKTGTVTRNVMEFRKFFTNGKSYGTDERMASNKIDSVDFVDPEFEKVTPDTEEFFRALAVCHTIVASYETGSLEYKASSPDELALVSAANFFGVEVVECTDEEVVVNFSGNEEKFKVFRVLEFTSARKRMSVIVEYPDGSLWVVCKGADNVIKQRLADPDQSPETWSQLDSYASEGYRTLVIARKKLDPSEFETWNSQYEEALGNLANRNKLTNQLAEEIERDFELLGVTAVEDKLQDKVPETISLLKEAGVIIWLLTGDKIETAINIGYSCSLLSQDMGQAVVDGSSATLVQQQLSEAIQIFNSESHSKYSLVISGDSLLRVSSSKLIFMFLRVIDLVDVVIACRVSPQQKADIVKFIREVKKDKRTLAIGDGANDVNMILAAHVGVGITGLEGTQAVRAADYSIAQFSYLKRLMLVHGRECYRRNANLVCYNFYKNILLVMPLFFYGAFSAYSAQIAYNMWTYQLFNVSYAFLPIALYAIFDKDIDHRILETSPNLYSLGLKGDLFSNKAFWIWVTEAVVQSVGVTLILVYAIGYWSGDLDGGRSNSMWVISEVIMGAVIIIVNIRVLQFSILNYWFSILAVVLSIGSYFLSSYMITTLLPISEYFDNFDGRGSTVQVFTNPNFYTGSLLVVVGCLLFVPIIKHCIEFFELVKPAPKSTGWFKNADYFPQEEEDEGEDLLTH